MPVDRLRDHAPARTALSADHDAGALVAGVRSADAHLTHRLRQTVQVGAGALLTTELLAALLHPFPLERVDDARWAQRPRKDVCHPRCDGCSGEIGTSPVGEREQDWAGPANPQLGGRPGRWR